MFHIRTTHPGTVPTLLVLCLVCAAPINAADRVDFARDIRPILSDNCFQCHGPDAGQREAELRLDTRDGALGKREDAAAFVAGKPNRSAAYQRMTATDADERMPPPDSGKQLSDAQITLVRRWIEQGATWSEHWAFVAPTRPEIPQVKNDRWVRNPIDAFVLARLEAQGLAPSPEADRVTLLRRLSLDLVGLPPDVDTVDGDLSNKADDTYAGAVDRLLDSPHYGERWGRHWLDAARYADSDGFEKDKPRFVWFYRDWVINALNRDLPYDRFVVEQIAGDLLPGSTQDQIVATGFLRNSMINEEGGVDPEQFRMEAMYDRMDAIGKSILGITIQCAQCHDHKYDPLTQLDYYRMFAFLNNNHEANVAVYTAKEQMQRAELFRQIGEIVAELKRGVPAWQQQMAAWEQSVRDDQPDWQAVVPMEDDLTTGGQKYIPQKDGSLLAQSYAPTKHDATFRVRTDVNVIAGFRLELLNHDNLPRGGPGRSILGTAALTEFFVETAPAAEPNKKRRLKIARATADVNPPQAPLPAIFDDRSKKRRVTGPIEFAVDGDELTAWGHDVGPHRRNLPRKAVFTLEEPITNEGGTLLTFHLRPETRRLEQRRQPEPQPGPVSAVDHCGDRCGCRSASAPRAADTRDPCRKAHQSTDCRGVQLLADDRSRVERGQRQD